MQKIVRTSTIPLSLNILLKGQLKFLSKKFEIIGLSSQGNDLIEVGKREEIKTISVDMERGISPFKDLISLFKLYSQFRKEKPTIIHSITPKAGLLTMLAGKISFFKNFRYSENLNGVEDADLWIRIFNIVNLAYWKIRNYFIETL